MPADIPLTTSINILHVVSLFVTIFILVLSIQDSGICSLCLNPFFAIITIGYHVTMLILAYYTSTVDAEDVPVPSVAYTITAYILSLGWLGAFIAMAVVLASREKVVPLFDLQIMIPQTMRVPQKIQIMLDPLECVIIGNIAIKNTIERLRLCKSRDIVF